MVVKNATQFWKPLFTKAMSRWVGKRAESQHLRVSKLFDKYIFQKSYKILRVPDLELSKVNRFSEQWHCEAMSLFQSNRFSEQWHCEEIIKLLQWKSSIRICWDPPVRRQSVQCASFQGMKFSRTNSLAHFKACFGKQTKLIQNCPSLFLKGMGWRDRFDRKQTSSDPLK